MILSQSAAVSDSAGSAISLISDQKPIEKEIEMTKASEKEAVTASMEVERKSSAELGKLVENHKGNEKLAQEASSQPSLIDFIDVQKKPDDTQKISDTKEGLTTRDAAESKVSPVSTEEALSSGDSKIATEEVSIKPGSTEIETISGSTEPVSSFSDTEKALKEDSGHLISSDSADVKKVSGDTEKTTEETITSSVAAVTTIRRSNK